MKTRAMKKVLSIVCVLALMMSVCVVGLVGITSAAETYTLNVNGITETKELEAGATLPTPQTPYEFLGWYDSLEFTNKVTTAGDAKTLYAKFSSTVINFENGTGYYNPKGTFGKDGTIGDTQLVADPNDASNTVLAYDATNSNNKNFAPEAYAGSGKGFKPVAGVQYEISFKAMTTVPTDTKAGVTIRLANDDGIGASSNKSGQLAAINGEATPGQWITVSYVMTFSEANVTAYPYLIFCNGGTAMPEGMIYIDDITITPVEEKQYTFINKGVKETAKLLAGADLPEVNGSIFEGWYDKTLTYKFDKVPASCTELYAKYTKMTYKFDSLADLYDPNDRLNAHGISIVDAGDGNKALQMILPANKRRGFAPVGAIGAEAGYTIVKGQTYTVSFKYKASGITTSGSNVSIYTSNDYGIGNTGTEHKTALTGWTVSLENSDTWVTVEKQFILAEDSTIDLVAKDNLFFTVYTATVSEGDNAVVLIDDFKIAPFNLPVAADDVVMDFEPEEGKDKFEWSVEGANNYTASSGNGYVNRGELVKDGDNTSFRVKHFGKKGANIFFTVDNGETHFELVKGGIYTIEFDYKVEHSETESKLGLMYVKPTTATNGAQYEIFDTYAEFETRDDEEWAHYSLTFYANPSSAKYSSLGLYVYNSTNVPEINIDTGVATATSVLFDNIKIVTHSATGNDGLITFDQANCTPIVSEGEEPVGALPQPTKYGYVFAGWMYDIVNADQSVSSVALTETSLMPYGITEAYATWTLAEGVVEVSFRTNVPEFDDNTDPVVGFPGEAFAYFPADPVSSISKFEGWYYDRTFTKPLEKNADGKPIAPKENAVLYAKWSNAGTLIDFENYPNNRLIGATDRASIVTLDDGNKVFYYNFSSGANQSNTSSIAGTVLHTGTDYVTAIEGLDYEVTFKYKLIEAKASGAFGSVLGGKSNTWSNRQEQTGRMNYGSATNEWLQGSFSFTAKFNAESTTNNNYLAFGVSNDCKVYVDDIVIKSSINNMNVYGSAVIFNTNGGNTIDAISGDEGDKLVLPTPKKAGYKFVGWYTDSALETPLTATTFGSEQMILYAKWQLGKFVEDFEEFPGTVKSIGVAGAYSFYADTTAGYDASNVHGGTTSLFRNGATAGIKNFTCMRSNELALTVGDTYTIKLYVKPTSIGDVNGTISLLEMGTFTGIAQGTVGDVIKNVSELKEGEWNEITYTFTAKSEFIGISTTAGNDMYFDDISITLKGYTGSANTGDASVNPIFVVAIIVLAAGALLITGKKVFSK